MPQLAFLSEFTQLFERFGIHWRRRTLMLMAMTFVGAIAELSVIGAIVPFLAIIADPTGAHGGRVVGSYVARTAALSGLSTLHFAALLFIAMALAAAGIRLSLTRLIYGTVFQVGHEMTVAVYSRVIHQPYAYHISNNSSEMMIAVNRVVDITHNMMLPLVQSFSAVIIAGFIMVGLFVVDPIVAGSTFLCFGIIYLVPSLFARRRLLRNGRVIARMLEVRVRSIQEAVGGIRDVLLDHAQPVYVDKFSRVDQVYQDRNRANVFLSSAPRLIVESLGMILIAVLAVVMSGRAGGIYAALPVLGALAIGAQRMMPLFQVIYQSWAQIISVRSSFEGLSRIAALPPGLARSAVRPLPFRREIEMTDIVFDYGNGIRVIDGINLAIPKGCKVAFIGRTGCGKTTLVDIVMGLLQPTGGTVRIDKTVLDATGRKAWQENIAHVSQSTYLSDTTLAENIAFGIDPEQIDSLRLREAARAAELMDFVDTLPEGFATGVGERGVRLSGGQRQRIGIARALYKRSPVLILDEATSALDDATEAAVMANLEAQGDELTLIIIAHRLSTVERCDTVYRMDAGRVVARGTFAEVVGPIAAQPG